MRVSRAILVLVAGLLALVIAAPAQAKGPRRVTITGPGLAEPVVLLGPDAANLFFGSGLGLAACRPQDGCRSHRPQGDLGPRFVATYVLPIFTTNGRMVRGRVVQILYPQAQPKPLAYVPAGQRYFGARTVGGTVTLGAMLLESVTGLDLGAAPPPVVPAPSQAAAPTPVVLPPAQASAPSPGPAFVAGVAVGAVALSVIALWTWRRRYVATPHPAG